MKSYYSAVRYKVAIDITLKPKFYMFQSGNWNYIFFYMDNLISLGKCTYSLKSDDFGLPMTDNVRLEEVEYLHDPFFAFS